MLIRTKQRRPLKVLFDSNLWNEGVTQEYYVAPKTIEWPKGTFRVLHIAELGPRVLRRKTLEQSREIFEVMRYVAELANGGRIRLYDTMELVYEWMGRSHGPSLRNTEFDVLKGVRIIRLEPPMQRTVAFGAFNLEDNFKDQRESWLENITEPRFLELKRVINRAHWADAFHLWTAEVYGLDCILTMETKVRNSLDNQKRVTSPVEILSPFELVQRLLIGYRLKRKCRSFFKSLIPAPWSLWLSHRRAPCTKSFSNALSIPMRFALLKKANSKLCTFTA
jgi:hypothetical protein